MCMDFNLIIHIPPPLNPPGFDETKKCIEKVRAAVYVETRPVLQFIGIISNNSKWTIEAFQLLRYLYYICI